MLCKNSRIFTYDGFSGLRASLDRLQLSYVDIVFANKTDSLTPTEGKLDPLTAAVTPIGRIFRVEGKITTSSIPIQIQHL